MKLKFNKILNKTLDVLNTRESFIIIAALSAAAIAYVIVG